MSGVNPHLALVRDKVSLLFMAAYTGLSGMHVSRDPVFTSHLPVAGIQACSIACDFFHGFSRSQISYLDKRTDSHTCKVLPTEPPPLPLDLMFSQKIIASSGVLI